MKKQLFFAVALAFTASLAAHAQTTSGCVNSPENPTVVLALVGSAGAVVASARTRIRARRSNLLKK